MKEKKSNCKGQAIVKHIIIVFAVGVLGIMGAFRYTLKDMVVGVINVFDGDTNEEEDKSSKGVSFVSESKEETVGYVPARS